MESKVHYSSEKKSDCGQICGFMEYISYECRTELGKQFILHVNGLVFDARMVRAWFGDAVSLLRRNRKCTILIFFTHTLYVLRIFVGSYKALK